MGNTKTLEIEELYDGVLDGIKTPLEDLIVERQNLQEKLNTINKTIQCNLLLNINFMLDNGFSVVKHTDIKTIYSKGEYRIVTDLLDVYNIKVYSGISVDPFNFYIDSKEDFYCLLKMLEL